MALDGGTENGKNVPTSAITTENDKARFAREVNTVVPRNAFRVCTFLSLKILHKPYFYVTVLPEGG